MNRVKLCDEVFKELFASESNHGEGDNPELMQILQRFIFGEVSQVGNLDANIREMITITILGVYQCFPQLKAHILAAFNTGVTPLEVREILYQLMPFIGCPKTLNAVAILDEVLHEKGVTLPLKKMATVSEENRYEKGLAIQNALYGSEIKEKYAELPQPFNQAIPDFLTAYCFGDFYAREGLDIKQRELLTLIMLLCLGCKESLRTHVEVNLKIGNRKETILTALLQAMPYVGIPTFFQGIHTVQDLLLKDC